MVGNFGWGFIFQRIKSWTGSTRGELGRARAVHRGPTAAQTEGAVARRRAHRSTASCCSGAPKLTGGGAKEREENGELDLGLTGARVAAWRLGDGGAEPEATTLGESDARAWREEKRGWGGAVKPGVVLTFYRGRGSVGEGWPGLTPVLMALTPLKTGGEGG
jgi:hypothetical protein